MSRGTVYAAKKTVLVTTPQNDTCTVYFLQTAGQEFDFAGGLTHLCLTVPLTLEIAMYSDRA